MAEHPALRELLSEAARLVPTGSKWRDHAGHEHTAIGVALREEDEQPCVITSDGSVTWVHLLGAFLGEKGFKRLE